jgi:hypothetical protein
MGIPGLSSLEGPPKKVVFSPSRPMTLVVDGDGMLRRLYHGGLDWLRGGDLLELRNSVVQLIANLRSNGVTTVWVFDGAPPDEVRLCGCVYRGRSGCMLRSFLTSVFGVPGSLCVCVRDCALPHRLHSCVPRIAVCVSACLPPSVSGARCGCPSRVLTNHARVCRSSACTSAA